MTHRTPPFLILLISALASSGCGIFIGSVKPVDEKGNYGVLDLAKMDPARWSALDPQSGRPDGETEFELSASEVADVAFQSKQTAAIISLNSACRNSLDYRSKTLKELTDELLLGIETGDKGRIEIEREVSGVPALETTITGKVNRQSTQVRTVVLTRGACVYDLMFVARPKRFGEDEPTFQRFVDSLRIRGRK